MLAAMTHPSRVLNLDMKAKLCMPKSYIYIYIVYNSREAKVRFDISTGLSVLGSRVICTLLSTVG